MFKQEMTRINKIKHKYLKIYALICITTIVVSYYLDGAIIFSFGLIPALCINMYKRELNINSDNTPYLNFLAIIIMLLFIIFSFLLVKFKSV